MTDEFDEILFAFAKEFGWTPQQVRELPVRLFYVYVEQLSEYMKAKEAASKGKKYKRSRSATPRLSQEEKDHKRELIEKWKRERAEKRGDLNGSDC